MANDFQIQAVQLGTSFAELVPGINTATTNQTVHVIQTPFTKYASVTDSGRSQKRCTVSTDALSKYTG